MRLILFGTSGCHLCEQAEVIINACVSDGVEYVDIAEQEQWQERYAVRIPVLYDSETKQELSWPFSLSEVEDFIGRGRVAPRNCPLRLSQNRT
ncbi:MAG TPA: glutaredoxin family protein [Methylobacter sp.]